MLSCNSNQVWLESPCSFSHTTTRGILKISSIIPSLAGLFFLHHRGSVPEFESKAQATLEDIG